MKANSTIQKFGPGGMHYIQLDPTTLRKVTAGGNKRVLCTLNDTLTIHAAVMKTKEGLNYVMVGAKYLKQLKLKEGSQVKAAFKIDDSELQFHIPEEFAEVIATDPDAAAVFSSLTDGRKRGLIALVNMVRSTDKKIERALLIAQKLKAGISLPAAILSKKY